MKTTILLAIPALLVLSACGEANAPEAAESARSGAPAVNPDDESAHPKAAASDAHAEGENHPHGKDADHAH